MPKLFSFLILVFLLTSVVSAQITSIELSVLPKTAKIRPLETAVITAEFYGKKKKGIFDGIFGNAKQGAMGKVSSSNWKASLNDQDSGWISKPFLFQEDDEKTKTGFENFIKQGLGAASAKNSILYTAPSKPGEYKIDITEGSLSKSLTITVGNFPQTLKDIEVSFQPKANTNSADRYFYIAEHYAPFIAQETWFNPKADYLARFDYDKNWKGDDNWENLEKGSSQAYAYYGVMETKTHWFIHYNFFHARDYSDVCIVGTCHENDNEGLILTVRKDESKFGKLEVMETLAHNNIYSFTNDGSIKKGVHQIDGDIALYKNAQPIIFIEAGGHGVFSGSYRTSFFSPQAMDFKQNTGITYVYKGKAESPKHSNDREVGYELLPIYDELWSKGNQETDESNDTFDNFYIYEPFGNRPKTSAKFIAGAFKGRTASDNKAKPFWAWHDRRTKKKKVLNTGQWALDPAYAISMNLNFPSNKPVSTEYIFNPYLDIDDLIP